jgi:hypothetical protein
MARTLLISALLIFSAASPLAGCGGGDDDKGSKEEGGTALPVSDPSPEQNNFHVNGEASRYAGPAPLKVQFAGRAFHTSGKLHWYWGFEDGTSSTQQNPVHTFTKAGSYLVQVEAKDEKGHASARGLYFGVWPKKVWAAAQAGRVNQPLEVRRQRIRTNRRLGQLKKECLTSANCTRLLAQQRKARHPTKAQRKAASPPR